MILSLALIAAAPVLFPQPKTPTSVLQISCRQGECYWQKIRTIETVRSDASEVLRKLTSRVGRSEHGVYNNPPKAYSPKLKIAWEPGSKVEYVLCSKNRPTVIFADDGEVVVHRLGLTNLGGYEYSSATLYMFACHNIAPDKWSEKQAAKMGYSKASGKQDEYKTVAEALATLN